MRILCSFLLALALATHASGQGAITPPGAPAPTMKTLDQVEARTPIAASTTTVTINANGSYYLTGNVTVATGNGINIYASNVTLDLNGFTVSSTAPTSEAASTGIDCNGSGSVVVRNGQVRSATTVSGANVSTGPGFAFGVIAEPGVQTAHIEHVDVTGVALAGIVANSNGALVSGCQTFNTVSYGIFSNNSQGLTVERCVVTNSYGIGIKAAIVRDCAATSAISSGIYATQLAENSNGIALSGSNTGGFGLYAAAATNCRGQSVAGTALSASVATNCTGDSTGAGKGIQTTVARGCSGTSATGTALQAITVTDCYAYSGSGTGIGATHVANSFGGSGAATGLFCTTGVNSQGQTAGTTASAVGIDAGALGVVTGCYGAAGSAAGFSIKAKLANGCSLGQGNATGIVNKVNTF